MRFPELKLEIASYLISLPGFDGMKDAHSLCECYTEQEVNDMLEAYAVEFSDEECEDTEFELTPEQAGNIRKYTAQKKYDEKNTMHVTIKLNRKTAAKACASSRSVFYFIGRNFL